jgi:hypothetical protein
VPTEVTVGSRILGSPLKFQDLCLRFDLSFFPSLPRGNCNLHISSVWVGSSRRVLEIICGLRGGGFGSLILRAMNLPAGFLLLSSPVAGRSRYDRRQIEPLEKWPKVSVKS